MNPDKKAKQAKQAAAPPVVVVLPGGDELTLHKGVTFKVYDGTTLEVYDAEGQPVGAFAQWVGVYK